VILCILFSGFSLLSKEQGVTALAVCAGYDVLINWSPLWKFICEICASKRKRKLSGESEVMVNEHVQLTEGESKESVSSKTVNDTSVKVTTVEPFELEPSEAAQVVGVVIRRVGKLVYKIKIL